MSDQEHLAATLEMLVARLDVMHEDQRRAIEKLNRLRLVVDAARDEQRALAARLDAIVGTGDGAAAGRLESPGECR